MQEDCPGVGVIDSIYFIAYNLNHPEVDGIEFRVLYPLELTHIADQVFPGSSGLIPEGAPKAGSPVPIGVTLGSTAAGVSAVWGLPQNGFFPLFIGLAIVQWNCAPGCATTNIPIQVVGHPLFNASTPQYTDRPTNMLRDATGLTSLICETVPVEETTWGRVKALYSE